MAGRFMLEKVSHSSRLRNLLGARFSSASALFIRTTASDGGTTLGNHLRGLSAHPSTVVLSNHVIHSSVGRYYSTFSFSCPAAKTRSPTTGMLSSIITHPMKPAAFVDFVRSPKRTFSSKPEERIKLNIDWEAEKAAMEAELEAAKRISDGARVEELNASVRADFEHRKAYLENLKDTANADLAAWIDEMDKDVAKYDRILNIILFAVTVVAVYGLYLMDCGLQRRRKELIAARANVEDQNP